MFLNKKGLGMRFLVILLVVIASGAFLIYFAWGPFMEAVLSMSGGGEREICRRSVDLNAKRLSVKGIQVTDPFVDVKCKIIPVEIKEKNPEEIKKILADRLYWTWVDFRRGEKELFEHAGGTFCWLRYAPISFEHNVEVNNFIEYLTREKPKGEDVSYWESLMDDKLSGDISELKNILDDIDTSRDHAIVFVIHKFGFWEKKLAGIAGLLAGGGIGYKIGVGGAAIIAFFGGGPIASGAVIAAFTTIGATAGGVSGYSFGTSYEDFTANVHLIPYDEIVNLECEA